MAQENTTRNLKIGNPLLGEDNWATWLKSMVYMLQDKGLCTETSSSEGLITYEIKDGTRSRRAIDVNCSEEMHKEMVGFTTAPEMWTYLHEKYSGKNKARKIRLIKELVMFHFAKYETIEKALIFIEGVLRDLVIANGSKAMKLDDISSS
jgi:hypothetical protein